MREREQACGSSEADLRRAWRDVREICDALERAATAGTRPQADLASLLDTFADRISRYFQLEEAFQEAGDPQAPGPLLAERAAALAEEHAELITRAREIGAQARASAFLQPELANAVATLLEDFRRHEREENEILQKAYCLDIGAGD